MDDAVMTQMIQGMARLAVGFTCEYVRNFCKRRRLEIQNQMREHFAAIDRLAKEAAILRQGQKLVEEAARL